ncbi:MAG: hypothetical protein ACXAD7_17120 [Candidatus Kariarchaeaceae archaeon]
MKGGNYLSIILFILLISPLCAKAATPNVLLNAGFEDWSTDLPSYWYFDFDPSQSALIVENSEDARSGNSALGIKFTTTGGNRILIIEQGLIGVEANIEYKIGSYWKGNMAPNSELYFKGYWYNSSGDEIKDFFTGGIGGSLNRYGTQYSKVTSPDTAVCFRYQMIVNSENVNLQLDDAFFETTETSLQMDASGCAIEKIGRIDNQLNFSSLLEETESSTEMTTSTTRDSFPLDTTEKTDDNAIFLSFTSFLLSLVVLTPIIRKKRY